MGRVEILTGRERRRIWSDDQKLAILEEVVTGGQIYAWRRKFAEDRGKLLQEPCFLPVTLVESEAATPGEALEEEAVWKPAPKKTARTGRIAIRCKGGRLLKVDAGIDPLMLQ